MQEPWPIGNSDLLRAVSDLLPFRIKSTIYIYTLITTHPICQICMYVCKIVKPKSSIHYPLIYKHLRAWQAAAIIYRFVGGLEKIGYRRRDKLNNTLEQYYNVSLWTLIFWSFHLKLPVGNNIDTVGRY